jgi:hypothetical protein
MRWRVMSLRGSLHCQAPSLRWGFDGKSLFTASTVDEEGTRIERLGIESGTSHPLWATTVKSSQNHHQQQLSLSPQFNSMFLADGITIKRVPITCSGLYDTCEQVPKGAGEDTLGCGWCAELGGEGRVIALAGDACAQGH